MSPHGTLHIQMTYSINTMFMFQRATTNKGVVLIWCIFPSLCNIAHSRTINMHTALISMHIDRQTCPILCIICPCGKDLSVQQESQRLTLQNLQLRRWKLYTFIFGMFDNFPIFFRNSVLGHLLVTKRMYIRHVSFWGVLGQKNALKKRASHPRWRCQHGQAMQESWFGQVLIIQMWQGKEAKSIWLSIDIYPPEV